MRLFYVPFALAFLAVPALAGPPFLTDDPEPVEHRHFEAYVFSTLDRTNALSNVSVPAFEVNLGATPNLQLHVIMPLNWYRADSGPRYYGPGDVELGAKFRFVQERGARPMIGIYPMVEVGSGDVAHGLGNGQTWYKLPLWIQKSWGPWTSYGGAGYVVNRAEGMRDHAFFGWLLQRSISKRLSLGGELFDAGRPSNEERHTLLANAGGIYKITPGMWLLLSAGHSVHGDSHTIGYVALYWTFGSGEDKRDAGALSLSRTMPDAGPRH